MGRGVVDKPISMPRDHGVSLKEAVGYLYCVVESGDKGKLEVVRGWRQDKEKACTDQRFLMDPLATLWATVALAAVECSIDL